MVGVCLSNHQVPSSPGSTIEKFRKLVSLLKHIQKFKHHLVGLQLHILPQQAELCLLYPSPFQEHEVQLPIESFSSQDYQFLRVDYQVEP